MTNSDNESDQTIVINDLLSFTWCKIKLCSKDKVLKCIEDFYSVDEASDALKTLLTALPNNNIKVHKKLKDVNPFLAIFEILQSCPSAELPIFVCKNLNNIPKLETVIKREQNNIVNKREFYKEHQRIKVQLNEVFSSLYELRKQFLTITESDNSSQDDAEIALNAKTHSGTKDLAYLQTLIDEEEEEIVCDLEDFEDEINVEQQINLLANRQQRASLRNSKGTPLRTYIPKRERNYSNSKQSVVNIKKEVTFSGSDSLENDVENFAVSNFESENEVPHLTESDKENRYLIVEHQFDPILGTITLFKCSACVFVTNDEETAVDHTCNEVPLDNMNDSLTVESPEAFMHKYNSQKGKRKKWYDCYSCGSTFKMRKDLQKHIETHLEKGHRCPLCAGRFSLEAWLDHVRNCPGNGLTTREEHYCEFCDVFYADKRTLSFHKAFHDPSRPFECLECKFRFYTQKTVEDHFRSHKMHRNSKKCPFCDFRAAKQIKIEDHIRCHTGDRPYKCPKCERSCPTYNALKVHLTSHSSARNFPCDICGKRFKSQNKVASHRKIHTVERPHKCPICGKGFKFGLQMALHHRMHLDIRKHACPQCPYRARTAAILRGHMNTHFNTKPFKCTICDFRANHKSYLNWHIKYNHPSDITNNEDSL